MSSSGWLLKHVEVDFIFIVAKVLINKLKVRHDSLAVNFA